MNGERQRLRSPLPLALDGIKTPAEQARFIAKAATEWREGLREQHEKRLREEQEAGAYLSPPPTADDPTLSPASALRPTRTENAADWRRRASMPWPSGTK